MNNIFASYFQHEETRVPAFTKYWQGIPNSRKGACLESKMPIPFLKREANVPINVIVTYRKYMIDGIDSVSLLFSFLFLKKKVGLRDNPKGTFNTCVWTLQSTLTNPSFQMKSLSFPFFWMSQVNSHVSTINAPKEKRLKYSKGI